MPRRDAQPGQCRQTGQTGADHAPQADRAEHGPEQKKHSGGDHGHTLKHAHGTGFQALNVLKVQRETHRAGTDQCAHQTEQSVQSVFVHVQGVLDKL